MPAFDWYQATLREADADDVMAAVLGIAERGELRHAKGLQGYATRSTVFDDGEALGQVWHGGSHAYPHVVFTSDAAQAGAIMVRSEFPAHQVTRLDVREDFGGADAFDKMLPCLLSAAQRHRVRVDTRGDHLLRKEARTVYLGAASSAVRCRQYDKAAELRAKFAHDPVRLLEVPSHLTRLEVQVRPQGGWAKEACSKLEPVQLMGVSEWMRDIWREVAGQDLEPVQVTKPWRASDDDRAYAYLVASFGPLLCRRMEEHGDWATLGVQLGDDIAAHVEAQAKLKRRGS